MGMEHKKAFPLVEMLFCALALPKSGETRREYFSQMSQFRTEVLPFPWTPLIIIVLGAGLLYLIGKWISEFAQWMWYNRPAAADSDSEEEEEKPQKKKRSTKKRSSRRKDDSGSESDD